MQRLLGCGCGRRAAPSAAPAAAKDEHPAAREEHKAESECATTEPIEAEPTHSANAAEKEETTEPIPAADAATELPASEKEDSATLAADDTDSGQEVVGRCVASAKCDSTKPGECLALVGGDPALGSWKGEAAVRMATKGDSFPVWTVEIPCPAPGSEFKLVIVSDSGDVQWEPIEGNRVWKEGQTVDLGTYGVKL